MVRLPGLEPGTFGSTIRRSNQLSYSRPCAGPDACAPADERRHRTIGRAFQARSGGGCRSPPGRRRSRRGRQPPCGRPQSSWAMRPTTTLEPTTTLDPRQHWTRAGAWSCRLWPETQTAALRRPRGRGNTPLRFEAGGQPCGRARRPRRAGLRRPCRSPSTPSGRRPSSARCSRRRAWRRAPGTPSPGRSSPRRPCG